MFVWVTLVEVLKSQNAILTIESTEEAFWTTDIVNFNCPIKLSTIYFKNMAQHDIPETIRGSWSVTMKVSQRSKLGQEKNLNKITPRTGPDFSMSESRLLLETLAHQTYANYQHIDQVSSLVRGGFMVSWFFKNEALPGSFQINLTSGLHLTISELGKTHS